jgi:hypothetical protein
MHDDAHMRGGARMHNRHCCISISPYLMAPVCTENIIRVDEVKNIKTHRLLNKDAPTTEPCRGNT